MSTKSEKMAIRRNLKLFPVFVFLYFFRPIRAIMILFTAQITGSLTEGMFYISLILFSTALFEVPTGVLSDKISRKKTLLFGIFFDILGAVLLGFSGMLTSIMLLLFGVIIQGLGKSFYSGTADALLYGTLENARKITKFHSVSGRMDSIGMMSLAVSALFGAVIADIYSFATVMFLTIIPLFISFCLMCFFVEPTYERKEKRETGQYLRHIYDGWMLIRKNPKLRYFALSEIITLSCSRAIHGFEAAYYEQLISVWLIGVIRLLKQAFGSISFWFSGNVIDKYGHYKSLMAGLFFMRGINFVALIANSYISPFLMSTNNAVYGVTETAGKHLRHIEYTNQQRATMSSIISMVGYLMYGVLSILFGVIGDLYSPIMALWFGHILMLPVIYFYYKGHRA